MSKASKARPKIQVDRYKEELAIEAGTYGLRYSMGKVSDLAAVVHAAEKQGATGFRLNTSVNPTGSLDAVFALYSTEEETDEEYAARLAQEDNYAARRAEREKLKLENAKAEFEGLAASQGKKYTITLQETGDE